VLCIEICGPNQISGCSKLFSHTEQNFSPNCIRTTYGYRYIDSSVTIMSLVKYSDSPEDLRKKLGFTEAEFEDFKVRLLRLTPYCHKLRLTNICPG